MSTDILDTDLVVLHDAQLVPARQESSLIALAGTVEDIVAAQNAYQTVCRALLDASDIQLIGQREFKKKSAWRKLGVAFGVSTQILSTTHERNDRGRIVRTEVVARATAPNGRFAEGIGACDLYERCCDPDICNRNHVHCTGFPCKNVHFSNPQHDIPATAATRATNRAAADLFGMGEVSAEEMTDHDGYESPTTQTTSSAPQAPTGPTTRLNVPYKDKDAVKKLGARWDADQKTWYIPVGIDPIPLMKWVEDGEPESEQRYLSGEEPF
jgi:hypothetical protein